MAEINNTFKVKKGLTVEGNATVSGTLDVTGDVTAPTQPTTDNSNKVSTTAYVRAAIAQLVGSSPAALDTLNELAAALGNDPNFATTMTNELSLKAPLDSPTFTGIPIVPDVTAGTSTGQIVNSKFVTTGLALKADIASPTLTGVPQSPTAAQNTNTDQIATTKFVLGQAGTANPLMNGVAVVGTSNLYSRQDHVHPIDTSRASLASPALTGTPTTPNAAAGTNNSQIANTAYVDAAVGVETTNRVNAATLKANIASPAFTGNPTAPNPNAGDSSQQIATTKFVSDGLNLKANAAAPSFTGDSVFSGGIETSDFIQFPVVGGGRYTTNSGAPSGSITGAFKITLPVLYSDSMITFDLVVYEYASNATFALRIAGYNYGNGTTWTNTSVTQLGDSNSRTPNVRFGNDASKCCIWVGDTNTVWSYPQMMVMNLLVGFNGKTASWGSGWTIAPVTTFDTVKAGPLVPYKAASLASPSFSGIPLAPTAAAGTNNTQIATTGYADNAVSVLNTNVNSSLGGKSDKAAGWTTKSLSALDSRTIANPLTGLGYAGGGRFRFGYVNDVNISAGYADIIDLSTYTDNTGGGFNSLYLNKSSQLIQHKFAIADTTSWTVKNLQYSDGTGATGTWPISITGSAGAVGSIAPSSIVRNDSTSASDPFGLVTFAFSLTLTTAWQNTSINASNLAAGTYAVQVFANDSAVGGGQNNVYYSGIMSWYGSDTDSTDTNEIVLHRAGVASGSGCIYLRTQATITSDARDLMLQISALTNNTGASTYTFKFRRLI